MDYKAFASFSGGKDCHLSIFRAQEAGWEVKFLFTMFQEDNEFSRAHHLPSFILERQAQAMGLELHRANSTWEEYEKNFKKAIRFLKGKGINSGVFGDIDLVEHREWVERVCKDEGIYPLLPLWGEEHQKVAQEIVKRGFVALVIMVNDRFLDSHYLGRRYDYSLIEELVNLGIDPCGEKGEFHTLVVDGPLYHYPIPYQWGEIKEEDGHHFIEVK